MEYYMQSPISEEDAGRLRVGDYVYLTGVVYSARDAAHKRMKEALDQGKDLPIELKNNVIYYMGPSPAREGRPIGSAGPTTASRMDKYTPALLDLGLRGMIGKGRRSAAVREAVPSAAKRFLRPSCPRPYSGKSPRATTSPCR